MFDAAAGTILASRNRRVNLHHRVSDLRQQVCESTQTRPARLFVLIEVSRRSLRPESERRLFYSRPAPAVSCGSSASTFFSCIVRAGPGSVCRTAKLVGLSWEDAQESRRPKNRSQG